MKKKWFKLDNAAKIFPPTSSKKDPKVFRFVCVLKEDIDEDILQESVNEALDLFPNFKSTLKKGLFWYYLETVDYNPIIKKEKKAICSPLYTSKNKLLFRVNYYLNRINLEVYHAISDGAGALELLKTIVHIYLDKKYKLGIDINNLDYDASINEKNIDSFDKYYKFHLPFNLETKKIAYHISGEKIDDYRFKVITGHMSVAKALNVAHSYKTTLTGLIVSVYIWSIRKNMKLKEKNKTIYVDIPVNLRKYFESQTARNFFSVLKLGYNEESDRIEDIIVYVDNYLKKELKKENLFKRMNKFATVEHNFIIRLIPLLFKDIILKTANYFNNESITTSVSNLGIIKLPEEIDSYVDTFEIFVSTSRMQICLCSYLDDLAITFTSVFTNTDIIKDFYRKLNHLGLDIVINSNRME